MPEIAHILAGFALVSLILAIAAAISPRGRLQLRRLDGTASATSRHLELAAYLLMAAVALSAAAALLAVTGWFAN